MGNDMALENSSGPLTEMQKAQAEIDASQAAFDTAVASNQERFDAARERMRVERTGPTDSEKLYALAAAFQNPTRTGSFFETIGNVGGVLGDARKASREAEMQKQAMLDKYDLEQSKFTYEGAKTRREMARDTMKDLREVATAQAKLGQRVFRSIEKLNDGTLVAVYEDPSSGNLTKQPIGQGEQQLMPTTMLSNGQPVLRMGDKLFLADGTRVTQIDKPERKLSPTEMGLVDETTKRLAAGKEALTGLGLAIELNPTAFEGSLSGARKMLGSLFSSDDPAFVATELLDNTITGSALAQMKTIFGGNPTEGERKILLDIQGSSGKTRAVRERIFQEAREAVQRRLQSDAKTLEDIRSGSFGRVQPPASPTPGKPRVTNWKQ